MAAVVGEAFLSAFIEVVIDKLASPEFVNFIRGKKLDDNLLQRLKNTLYAVEAVLNDAEQKQIKDSAVNKWLDDLKDAVYVADDFLDHVATKAATQKKEVSNFFSRYFNFQDRDMVNKLEDIVERLESIFKLKDILGLKEVAKENYSWRLPSSPLEDGSNIYGRDQDKEAILKLLLDDDMSDGKVGVIPIVGMGGVGKTTLTQVVYNDENLKQEFDLQAWVCVSDEFDILKVTKTITQAITKSNCGLNDISLLHLELKEKLMGRKFLIVLDDVWLEDYVTWNFLIKPLQFGTKGSKILVTTRSEKVASLIQTSQGYRLKQLLDEDCWLVFANHACFSSASNGNTTLEKIGRQIVKKCDGSPLAAQSLGGLLRGKNDIKDWNNILNSNIWELSENESKIIPALRISYHYLPPFLKRCFVYCSLYPKDYEFEKDELILLWMAEDLLPPSKSGKTLEEVGCEYFDDLVARSFFLRCRRGSYFMMHDLVHDLAILLGGEFYFRSEELGKESKICMKTRHLSLSGFSGIISENFDFFGRVKYLRTLLPIYFKYSPFNREKAACVIMSNLKYLRVLSFSMFPDVEALPDSIGELIHLRYLDLSHTSIKTLPESLCNLYNLQTLKLFWCSLLTMLPDGMQNLVNLRHLDIRLTKIKEMPKGLTGLKNLQYLSDFIVGEHEGQRIKELGKLSNLHGSLAIFNLQNVANGYEALEAKVADKKNLDELHLLWSLESNFTDSVTEMDILDKLQPHQDLKRIWISGYRGTKFPEWVGHSSYHNMTLLSLSDCMNCCMLPSLGQLPSLRELSIIRLKGLETVGVEFLKSDDSFSGTPFPSLQSLYFRDMPCWEVWRPFESNAFPQLKQLKIISCPRLRGDLPNNLPALESLEISRCEQLASSLPRAPAIRRLEIYESNKVSLREIPLSVEDLRIEGSEVVESMFEAITITQPTSLQFLEIKNCSSVRSFPGDCLPASLKNLRIQDFRKLEFPKQQHELLQSLYINSSCDSLTSLLLETFPNLHSLTIKNLENLESLSLSVQDAALTDFVIDGCPKFVSFPNEGLSAPAMTKFSVSDCNKLKSLPYHMSTLLPKLESLVIDNCPEVELFPSMPPSLRSLVIKNCEKLMRSPFLASVDMLTHLTIGGPCDGVKSFPEVGLVLLPPSLTSLELVKLTNMEMLECKGLLHLTSLQQLTIKCCPKLENVAGERLPASLIKLEITECPLLEERCKMKHPEIWPKISHIRGIKINGRWIP
ncbi:putative disease resistance RPP13-like protein 1 [Lotus japonicus]|uniref:putative disease resistance RPP13-like protein 1 n=1 Tax=Lotus japonicus TaxID=34305 RepID=UPI002590ED2E|nr:putative disease resistance RPP13-like protein 1 [Lotus japonicus]XP_057434117.1 putative disease resistance RPP13-like protein 1 [Lotus japonicus]XP_057434118.1 putative disease resistance RPP13-like protein 1 [Lotus japonicus]XP_057434119.1 putative disease resistance RPP13-like protein 1 [Lotus japonicus]XP_057434120.1 putative disease resistance RPP13-like protein 1 [Lotus japonicus]XP_057434121.1 putative disease resistance RPP13-like protein 1 [Lotus japonicus]XP_057434122.1 putative